ncbi:ExbD/TolR family protein [Calycomorphotria hydatis]|uniref:Biopolymer transport protein ExbD/TolR n=1 Tax=Calycomorphotria hydatis TaxID=2528027 RepID=A0A517TBW2_9PLAN|nr:biopolymer transporter ExbD [Calycomorphotria hydatis]QDT65850.1 Biopolymer transport protein ExbD/TolR [Calycomorphotria hydatis]
MKFRHTGNKGEKIEPAMAPMIDVVFQLLIFFMLTLKIIEPEGDFNINMPIGQASQTPDEPPPPAIKVRLKANEEGQLAVLELNRRPLGNGAASFQRLNGEILRMLGNPNDPANDDLEVEIDADYNLDYRYTVEAISAVRGRLDPKSGQVVSYVEKIKFAPPRRPEG